MSTYPPAVISPWIRQPSGKREPDFCVPSFINEQGRASYRMSPAKTEPWRYNLSGARAEIARLKHGGILGFKPYTHEPIHARPNCIVRVYLK